MGKRQIIIIRKDVPLVLYKPVGIFQERHVFDFLHQICNEDETARDYSRFIDASAVKDIQVDLKLMKITAEFREHFIKREYPAKTGIYCTTDQSRKFAEGYKTLMNPNWINVFVTENLETCADFLEVDKQILIDFNSTMV